MMRNVSKNHLQQGQSLIEILISVFIISTALITIVLLTSKSVQLSSVSQNRETAIVLAKTVLEDFRSKRDSMPWSEFIKNEVDPCVEACNSSKSIQNVDYTAVTTLTALSPTRVSVVVTVRWDDTKGHHEVKQTTMLTQY